MPDQNIPKKRWSPIFCHTCCPQGPRVSGTLSGSTKMYQLRYFVSPARAFLKYGCSDELWFSTRSTITLMPRLWHSARNRSKSARVPYCGLMP